MKPNYIGHDKVYRHKRSIGEAGWDRPEELKKGLADIESFLCGIAFPDHPSMLELGCGAGNVALHFAAKGWTVCGVDISPFAIDWAREKAAAEGIEAAFVAGDLTQPIVLPIKTVDLVLDGHCLHCIIGDDRKMFLHNALRHVRSEGLMYIHTMCGDPVNPALLKDFDAQSRCMVHNGVAARFLGLPGQIAQEVTSAGFEIVKRRLQPALDATDQDSLLLLARPLR